MQYYKMSTNNVNIVNTNNWFQKMNTNGNQNVTNMVLSGTNPNMQMTLINSANDTHYLYSNYPISSVNGFTMSFQFYISGSASNLTHLNAFFGTLDYNVGSNLVGQGGVQVLINPGGSTYFGQGSGAPLQIISNGASSTWPAVDNYTAITAGAWQTVSITYNPSGTTNNWVVSYNGTIVMTYNNSGNIYGNPIGQNSTCGIGASTGATPATVFIRAVDLSVRQGIPLSTFKNTYSFYPEECFINKLSTYSQTNAAAAFGLRLLNASYLGPIINVRRGSDNATLDFYADSKGNLGTNLYGNGQTLLGWLAGSIGYVTRWYDQSNNGRDVIQATNANQPKIGTPLLDTMSSSGKSAARGVYTLYRANSTYTGATIKLRRSSDNVTTDFYADVYGNLTDASGNTFTSWIGSSMAYVDTWYDQSGSGNHATQSTTAFQPVYNGTLKLIDTQNSSTQFLNMPSGTVPVGTANAPYSFVFKHGSTNSIFGAVLGSGNDATNQANTIRYDSSSNAYDNYWYNIDFTFGTGSQRVTGNTVAITYNGSLQNGYINNNLTRSGTFTGGTTAAGQQYLFRTQFGGSSNYLNGQMYSVFIFGSALSDSDRMACTGNPTDLNIKYDGGQLLYNTTNIPIPAGLDNYTYVCNCTPMTNGFSVIVEQASNPLVNNTRAAFMISNSNSLYFAGHNNDVNMNSIGYYIPRKTIVICNHNLSTGNVVVNDNGTIYTYTTSASPSSLAIAASTFVIGRNSQGGEFYTGNINEIIVFRNTLTAKESMLYFTPNAITRKAYRSQPRLQIKDVPKDISPIPSGAVIALDTQMLSLSPGSPVTSWNGFTGLNSPVINAAISGTGNFLTIPPYVSLTNNNVSASLSTGQYLNAGSKSFAINTNGGFTAIWYGAFTGSPNNYERIFDFGNGTSDNIFVMRDATSSRIAFFLNNGGTPYYTQTGNAIVQNEWAVWTFRYTASTRYMEILKNGFAYSATTAGAAITDKTLSNTWIGRSNFTQDTYSSINTVGLYVYSSLITDAQIASVSNHLIYPTTATVPSTLPDYNNKVVRYGNIFSQGFRNGQAMYFTGSYNTNSYLDIQDVPNWPLTFCFWFYNINSSGGTGSSPAALCSADLTGFGIQVDIYNTGTTLAPAYSTNGSTYTQFTNSTIALNTWYHIAFVVTPTTVAYYLNNSLVQSVSAVVYNTNRLVIGKSGDNARPFNGYIADIRVFDYALRADEISLIAGYNGQAGQEIMNYNTPTNYLVNMSNWYNSSLTTYQTGSFGIASGLTGADFYIMLTNGTANASNTLYNSTRIQNYNSFTCSFLAYIDTPTDHGYYFYCGATSSTTVPTGTAGTSANSSYYIYFQITGTKGIYLYNDQGQQLAYSPLPTIITSSVYVPITIIYNRSTRNTWTVNVASIDILTYNDPNNVNWVSNIAGDMWGIGARTTTSGMNMYIRRVELSYTPFVNTINNTVNAQNNTKFPPGAMTAASTTFTGTGVLDGVYTASQSNPGEGGGVVGYYAFDNNSSSYAGEISSYNASTGIYAGGVSTSVKNLVTNVSTSYSGEWFQIQIPNAVTLNSFGLMGRQDVILVLERTPTTFYITGSNNGSTWELVHSTSGVEFSLGMRYFTCNANNTNKYRYFRLIANKIGNTGTSTYRNYVSIGAWDLFTQMNTVNANVIAVPPYSMTADTTTFAGNSIYDGTYTVTSSNTHSHPDMGPRYTVFDNSYGSYGNIWSPGGYYNGSTGAYPGSVSTTVSSVSQSGEWIQIQIPNPIVLYSFSLNFWWPTQSYWAKSFLIAASNDNSTWTNIYDTTTASFVYGTTQTFVVTGSPIAYRYFRLIVRSTSGIVQCEWWILNQWKLYTNASNFNLMKFPPAPLTADSPVTFTTVNANNWYNVMSYGVTSGTFTPVLSEADPFKQLRLTNNTSNVRTYCNVVGQPVMNYDSFTLTFQLYASNGSNGDFINLFFGGGGYTFQYLFEIAAYQGIRMNTSNVENPGASATNWWNSTWNNIRIEYLKGPTNTWTMFFNETQILQYSDPNWSNAPGSGWGFGTYNGTGTFDSYIRQLEMTIAPVSIPGNSIVSGNYIASASTVYGNSLGYAPSYAFNDPIKNLANGTMSHTGLNYTTSNGLYNGAITTSVSGTSYSGDWLQLQAPNALQLSSFSIYPRQDFAGLRSPRNFIMAGSNDGSTWYLLHTATGVGDWIAADKYFVCNGSNVVNKYSYFRLVVMAIGNPGSFTSNSNCVNILNLSLFTPISMNTSITPATPKGLLDGLAWKYYNGFSSNSVSYYTTNTYTNIGRCIDTTNMTRITNGQVVENTSTYLFSMEIFGYFRATVSGTWTFSLSSDDGSYLWIGENALVSYTTSNFNIGTPASNTVATCTVTLLAGNYYPIRIHYTKNNLRNANLTFSFTPPGGTQTFNGQGYFFSGTGVDSAFPQESAKIIKDLTNTNKDGVYYILVNGISTPVHCLMNDCYDGGGWMMLMKGTRGNAFQFSSNYWTAKNTLNAGDTTRSDADAKYDTFNYTTVKDVLAIWPDIPSTSYTNPYGQNGGSIFVSDGWTWMVNNWNETTRITPFTGFDTSRGPHQNTSSTHQPYGINNPSRYNGFGTWCSAQGGSYFHGFRVGGNLPARWGFVYNNETNEYVSSDVVVGIGLQSFSAGDVFNCCGYAGINRSARFELYGR